MILSFNLRPTTKSLFIVQIFRIWTAGNISTSILLKFYEIAEIYTKSII